MLIEFSIKLSQQGDRLSFLNAFYSFSVFAVEGTSKHLVSVGKAMLFS